MGPKVGIYFWIRVGVMAAALFGVITIMKRLNQPGALGAGNEAVNLCPTRVSSVSMIGRFAIMQDGLKWYRTGDGGERTELDPVAVEKWFGENCQLSGAKEEASPGGTPLMTLAYVSGLPATILMSADGVFSMNKSHFRSQDLLRAITALEHLPPAAKPGQNKDQ